MLHYNTDMLHLNSPNSPKINKCDICDYSCVKKSDMNKHLSSIKHQSNANCNTSNIKFSKNIFECNLCKKTYKSRVGIWRHKKTCKNEDLHDNENIIISDTISHDLKDTDIIKLFYNETVEFKKLIIDVVKNNSELQKQNNELQKQMLDVCKNSNNTTNNIKNTNSHNKTFNLQFFLNEQCKDAMNISDFAKSFDLQLSDFESVGELGYVEGITKIMLDKLNSMDIYKRPIHCSDAKREILYVKDDDKWEKEEKNNPKLRYAIKTISFNNMKLMGLWSSTYPESMDGDSRLNDKYMKLIKQSTGGNGEISDSENKIIKRIAKEMVIAKLHF
jgi:hypothetical protein